MLKTIITREFLDNVLNLRFMIGLILCLIITVACIIILTHDYRQELADYNHRVNLHEEFLSKSATTQISVYQMQPRQKPPERFRPLIIGISDDESLNSFDENPLPILFPPLDFLFIVTIIMSLLAILFSYDAVTGERQSGTLRLMIANSISRPTILLGKFIGGATSLIIPFILALVVGVLYINLNPDIQWDASAWSELGLLTAASITFIMSFYLLGLMVSTFSRYSSTSILNCLFLWVLLILVIPNVCPYISAQLQRVPSIRTIERREEEVKRACRETASQRRKELIEQFRGKYGNLFSQFEDLDKISDRKKIQELADADPQFKDMVDAFQGELARLRQEFRTALNNAFRELWADLRTKAAAQTRLAKNLAAISPLANFVYVARDLTGTGLRSLKYFGESMHEYMFRFGKYVSGVEAEVVAAHKNEPTPEGGWPLDIRDHPRFVFQEEALKSKLGTALPYWGILVLFNILFFAAAFAGFMRYDVR
ncbi:MAG: ABC transporter permease subunit [Planctomycetota bacterium]|jgi:ABC-type transport system involved in multi-copper enzyme maturation permease subunit